MTELSPAQQENARKNERAILHAVAVVSQKRVADLSGISETRLSRLKDGDLEKYCAALAALDLKLVPADAAIVTKAERKFMAEKMIEHYQAIADED